MNKKKKDGKIFTPEPIVKHMLYRSLWENHTCKQHIIDNSCGDGAFLREIVRHYCEVYDPKEGDLKTILETYVHGIEIDPTEHKKCLENLDAITKEYGVTNVKWDVQNRDALSCHDYDGKMDYVIGNPPYIRTHDLECDLSNYSFANDGMTDIYLAFYELGFRMLNENGRLCYITPSSWFTSLAGKKMREYVIKERCLQNVQDFGHTQVFDNATTYVAICSFCKGETKHNDIWYIAKDMGISISYEDMCIDGKFYFGTPEQLKQMREIIEYGKDTKRKDKAFQVKNGYATLADGVFIEGDVPWAAGDKYVIPATKASTLKWNWCIFPYDKNGNLVTEEEFKEDSPNEYELLLDNKEKLLERATDEPWYAYGRTQAIKDTFKEKWAVKSTIKDLSEPIYGLVSPGNGVYGGLYILTEHPEGLKVLETQDFMNYVKILGKYKSGGYYTFSSKDLENYLNWSYGKKKD